MKNKESDEDYLAIAEYGINGTNGNLNSYMKGDSLEVSDDTPLETCLFGLSRLFYVFNNFFIKIFELLLLQSKVLN